MRIRFDKIDGFIKIHNGIRYLVLFDCGCFDKICDRIKYLLSKKRFITDSISYNFGRIKIDSYNSLPIHNVIVLIKSADNKDTNDFYFNIFLEKCWYKDKSNAEYF